MKRALLVGLVAVSGCINFEKEYAEHGANLPSRDGGTLDAGTLDAGTLDAGTLDAGTLDAGFDAGVDAGYCTALGCFGKVATLDNASNLAGAVYGRPAGTLLIGWASGSTSYLATMNGDEVALGSLELNGADIGYVYGLVARSSGEFFTRGEVLAHHGPTAVDPATACGADLTGWHGGGFGLADDVWFTKGANAACRWTSAAGFELVPLTGAFGTITAWTSIVGAPDGGLWLSTSEQYGVFNGDGTLALDASVASLRRIGEDVYAWASLDGFSELWVYEGRRDAWRKLGSNAVNDVWGEREDDVWVLESQKFDNAPVLQHPLPDGGLQRFAGHALFPPLPTTSTYFQTLGGSGTKLMLMGNDASPQINASYAVELRRAR